jgi:RNA polymerase sigma factor (sigma-70 family)
MTGRVSETDARDLACCYRRLAGPLFSYTMILTRGDHDLGEDIVQDTFQAAAARWAKIRDLPDEQRLIRLKSIARNKTFDVYRRRRTAQVNQGSLPLPQAGDTGDTHQAAMLRIAGSRLRATVSGLPERQHLIAVMRFHDEMTIAAIAAELRLSTGTVSNEVAKLRRMIRKAIGGYIDLDVLP